jgi:thymidylate synthase (FAD)
MKLVLQNSVLYGQTPTDPIEMCRWIEMGGRTCYKSESQITETSSVKFVKRMLKNGHTSVLEHSNIVFKLGNLGLNPIKDILAIFGGRIEFHQFEKVGNCIYINGNLRAWLETIKEWEKAQSNTKFMSDVIMDDLLDLFLYHFNFTYIDDVDLPPNDNAVPDVCGELVTDKNEIPVRLRKYTMRHTTNRAMTHEIVRHRRNSAYSQESQRYVNYKGGIEFIIPVWATDLMEPSFIMGNTIKLPETGIWLSTMETLERIYISLINSGLKPQQARECLPNSTKTEIVVTRGYDAWLWFFHLRDNKACDPQMQELAWDAREQFTKINGFSKGVSCGDVVE